MPTSSAADRICQYAAAHPNRIKPAASADTANRPDRIGRIDWVTYPEISKLRIPPADNAV